MFACDGILFNHESPLRGVEFVTRKITYIFARIKYGLLDTLKIGNLEAKRDWGYAPEYVEAMWLMLQAENPDDYVIATGETHSVREFIELSPKIAGFDLVWEGEGLEERGIDRKTNRVIVKVAEEFFRPAEVDILEGNPEKAMKTLGWKPKTSFENLVAIMMEADLKRVAQEIKV